MEFSATQGLTGAAHVAETYLGVGHQALQETVFPVDFFENDQTLPSFTLVVRHFLVLAKEEQSAQKVRTRGEWREFVDAPKVRLTRVPRVAV